MGKVKVGLIGCGLRAKEACLPVIMEAQRGDLLELVSVCDAVEKVSREIGENYHVPYYTSAEKMLEKEKDMDFVCICTGDPTHHALGKLAAEHGKHVFVEKPMAITLPCCDVLIKACEKAGVYYEVGEQYFRCPTDRTIMKIIQSGLIGDVLRAYAIDPAPAHASAPSRSGVCMDMGVHRMSEIRTYIGDEPKQVTGLTKKFAPQKQAPGILQEDWGFALVEFEKDHVGACECTNAIFEDPNEDSYRQVVGTEGIIHVDARGTVIEGNISLRKKEGEKFVNIPVQKNRVRMHGHADRSPMSFLRGYKVLESIVVKTNPGITWKNPYTDYQITDSRIGVMDGLLDIANAALHDKPPEYGISARKDVEMCVAWYESSLKGKPVKLPITSMTTYEKRVHEAYKRISGHDPTDV